MVRICCDTADSIRSSSRLNSSKQPHAPHWHRPTKMRDIAAKSNVSSQSERGGRAEAEAQGHRQVSVTRGTAYSNLAYRACARDAACAHSLKTSTILPSMAPMALTVSVLPENDAEATRRHGVEKQK